MKRYILLVSALSVIILMWSCKAKIKGYDNLKPGENIRLNQLGYLPGEVKRVVVVNSGSSDFKIVDTTGNPVFSGKLDDRGVWDLSKERVKIADFSTFDKTGTYSVYVEDLGISYPFEISSNIYDDVFRASLKAFYIQRMSTPIEEKYAGKFSRAPGHPDMDCKFYPSSGRRGGSMPSPGGWYDAGDYNKYIVNAGYTVSMLLSLYENFPDAARDDMNIPESGNNISDLLDEIKWELDWAETMQDKDGGIFFKLTSKRFSAFIKPHEDTLARYVVGKSTSSALNFAAIFSQASRVWKETDSGLSERYLASAKRAWDWAIRNPSVVYRNPPDISTGAYSHRDFTGDFFWAAAELFVTTGEQVYKKYLESNPVDFTFVSGENWWTYLKNMGYYALILPGSKLEASEKELYTKAILADADRLIDDLEECPYRQPLSSFVWGSNSDILDLAIIFANAFRISGEKKYLDAAIETTDYIFGKNATGYSFVTGYGSKPVMNPHFRLAASDDIPEPIPGWVAGGPNANLNDEKSDFNPNGVTYSSREPAQCYMDLTESYASNEIAINWNAPLAYITGFLASYSAKTR